MGPRFLEDRSLSQFPTLLHPPKPFSSRLSIVVWPETKQKPLHATSPHTRLFLTVPLTLGVSEHRSRLRPTPVTPPPRTLSRYAVEPFNSGKLKAS